MNTDVPGFPPPYLGGQNPASRMPDQYEQATSLRSTMWQPPTTPAKPPAEPSLAERETARRGRLASTMILVFLLLWSGDCLYELARGNAAALPAFLIGLLILGIAFVLNFRGQVTMVGELLVLAI